MSGFTALNVEPDTDSEEEVDNTRELQIDEALKLYQNALKLHSQGPRYYREASEAYEALFRSEIFNYPESIPWYKRELQPELVAAAAAAAEAELEAEEDEDDDEETDDDFINEEGESNILLQTVYLSYKNRGQFIIDQLKSLLSDLEVKNQQEQQDQPDQQEKQEQEEKQEAKISERMLEAIQYFGEALDRDDTDLDLWRRTAKLSEVVQSSRLARFCLESIVDDDVDLETEIGESLGLERAFAYTSLQKLLSRAGDDVSTALHDFKKPRNLLLHRLIEKKADPFPYLANPTAKRLADLAIGSKIDHTSLSLDTATWTTLGDAILHALRDKSKDHDCPISGSVKIEMPEIINEPNEPSDNEISTGVIEDSAAKSLDTTSFKDASEVIQSTETPQDQPKEKEAEKTTEARLEGSTQDENPKLVHPRKRSSLSVDEPGESGRIKSKRLRARESQIESNSLEAAQISHTKYLEDLMEPYILADEKLFSSADDISTKLGWSTLGSSREFRDRWTRHMQDGPQSGDGAKFGDDAEVTLAGHLRSIMDQWDDVKAKFSSENLEICVPKNRRSTSVEDDVMKRAALDILSGSLSQENSEENRAPSSNVKGLAAFVAAVANGQMDISSVAFKWLEKHLGGEQSSYLTESWPTDLKRVLTTMIMEFDSDIYAMIHAFIIQLDELTSSENADGNISDNELTSFTMMAQALFELHLEILSATTKSDPVVAPAQLSMERSRVGRWCSLAYLLINHQINLNAGESVERLKIRHLWTAILHLNMSRDADSDYILESLRELKDTIISHNSPVIRLINNSIMREISANAIEQEVSRLRSLDFFTSLLAPGNDEPVRVIEHIAPLLEPDSVQFVDGDAETSDIMSRFKEAAAFLNTKSPSLRLYLWHRLQDAYDEIDHFPKVIDCCIHKIEVVVDGLFGKKNIDIPAAKEGEILLKSLNSLSTLLAELRRKVFEQPDKLFDCLDMLRLRAATDVFTKLMRLLYTFVVVEDGYKIGLMHPPDIRPASNVRTLDGFKDKLRCILVDCCTLQYIFLKEAISQNSDSFESPYNLRLAYLHACHGFLGIRFYCRYADKAWLRLMIKEIENLPPQDDYEYEMAQLYFDLYGLKFGAGLDAIVNHHCPFEPMDVHTAISIADFIMMQAKRINIKDLPKSELKAAIDTVQMSLGPPTRNFPSLNLNRRLLKNFLNSPIHHRRILRCFDGIEDVSISRANAYSTRLAENGWFSLLGQCALTRFRSQKRLSSSPTDDLDTAILNFRQELEHGFGDWKTWYFLALSFDLKLEEDIQWSADKINKDDDQVVEFQRYAINAYTVAIAHLARSSDLSAEDTKLSTQLYADFGNRLYWSSREPLSMKAFSVSHMERPFSTSSNTLYTFKPFAEMQIHTVWGLASYLFQQAISATAPATPGNWKYYFTYGKCLWKLFCCDGLEEESHKRPSTDRVLDAFVDAIDSLPRKKDSRSEPILEPHYKLASIVHKFVARGHLTPFEAYTRLQATVYAQKVPPPNGMSQWKEYILNVLKRIRAADKSNWHHRMPVRAAHIIYDSSKDATAAADAKAECTQQLFTKAMNLQVWRPENERAGRHFVYTTRYVYFFVKLLDQLNDRFNIEQIAKRVRKRVSDFAYHTGLWEYVCEKYIKILRHCENIPSGADETVFKTVLLDDFLSFAGTVEKFYLNHLDSPLLGVLREAAELKKLNGGLMKPSVIEDLIMDIYGVMYDTVARKTAEEAVQQETRERMRVDHLLENDKPLEKTSTPASEDALTPGSKAKSTKVVARKDIIRRAESLLVFVSRPQRPMPDEHSLVPMLAISIPIRTVPPAIGTRSQLLAAEQDSATEGVNATDDEDSELSELEKSPEPPRSTSSLQEILLQQPEQSANSASASFAGDEMEGAAPEASAPAPDGAGNNGTSSDIKID